MYRATHFTSLLYLIFITIFFLLFFTIRKQLWFAPSSSSFCFRLMVVVTINNSFACFRLSRFDDFSDYFSSLHFLRLLHLFPFCDRVTLSLLVFSSFGRHFVFALFIAAWLLVRQKSMCVGRNCDYLNVSSSSSSCFFLLLVAAYFYKSKVEKKRKMSWVEWYLMVAIDSDGNTWKNLWRCARFFSLFLSSMFIIFVFFIVDFQQSTVDGDETIIVATTAAAALQSIDIVDRLLVLLLFVDIVATDDATSVEWTNRTEMHMQLLQSTQSMLCSCTKHRLSSSSLALSLILLFDDLTCGCRAENHCAPLRNVFSLTVEHEKKMRTKKEVKATIKI